MAIMPFLKLSTANGDLGNRDFESDEDRTGNHLVGVFSATTSHAVTEKTGIFLELFGIHSTESEAEFEAYFNTGMTWAITPTWQLDGGLRVGLTAAAADFTPFLGMSTKF